MLVRKVRELVSRIGGNKMKRLTGTCLCVLAVLMGLLVPSYALADTGTSPVYRLYNPSNGDHHYTKDANEYRTLPNYGWKQEGVAWVSPSSSTTPVYRLYNPGNGDHHYTKDANEYRTLPDHGWKQEGVAWYSSASDGVPVYRLYNPHNGDHHFTKDVNEYRTLPSRGWKQEGVAWYSDKSDDSYHGLSTRTPVMSSPTTSVDEMVSYYQSTGATYPANVYSKYGASSITEFCTILYEEAVAEGVDPAVLFAQVCIETGNLQFGGDVSPEQCNFGGLGATGGGVKGVDFSSNGQNAVRIGLRAQTQHLKAYASTQPLNQACVDERFGYVKRGTAPYVEMFGSGVWAGSKTYASSLLRVISSL